MKWNGKQEETIFPGFVLLWFKYKTKANDSIEIAAYKIKEVSSHIREYSKVLCFQVALTEFSKTFPRVAGVSQTTQRTPSPTASL